MIDKQNFEDSREYVREKLDLYDAVCKILFQQYPDCWLDTFDDFKTQGCTYIDCQVKNYQCTGFSFHYYPVANDVSNVYVIPYQTILGVKINLCSEILIADYHSRDSKIQFKNKVFIEKIASNALPFLKRDLRRWADQEGYLIKFFCQEENPSFLYDADTFFTNVEESLLFL